MRMQAYVWHCIIKCVEMTCSGGVQLPSRTLEVELTTLSSNYHVEMNPSDVGNNDRHVVQEIIKVRHAGLHGVMQTGQLNTAGTYLHEQSLGQSDGSLPGPEQTLNQSIFSQEDGSISQSIFSQEDGSWPLGGDNIQEGFFVAQSAIT